MQRSRLGIQMAIILGGTMLGFVLIQHSVRLGETWLSAALPRAIAPGRVTVVTGTSINISPWHGAAFRAIVTPACSSAASICSLVCLATLIRSTGRVREVLIPLAAVAIVVLGNVARISGSVAVGLVAGRAVLVLFHDWVGGVFSFAYTLGGFILMLYLALPDLDSHRARLEHSDAG